MVGQWFFIKQDKRNLPIPKKSCFCHQLDNRTKEKTKL